MRIYAESVRRELERVDDSDPGAIGRGGEEMRGAQKVVVSVHLLEPRCDEPVERDPKMEEDHGSQNRAAHQIGHH